MSMEGEAGEIGQLNTRSGVENYLNRNRVALMYQSDAYRAASIRLKKLTEAYFASRSMGDRVAIYQLVRPLNHAGDLLEAAAKAMSLTMKRYNGLFIPQSTRTSGEVMEPDK